MVEKDPTANAIDEVFRASEYIHEEATTPRPGDGPPVERETKGVTPALRARMEAQELLGPPEHVPARFGFGVAILALKAGQKVARRGWNGFGLWLELQVPDAHSKMTLPYIFISYPANHHVYPTGSRVPWLASQTDVLADDWFLVF